MDKTAENITSLSHKPSNNEDGWRGFVKAKAKCFMRYVTVSVKVIALIGGTLLGAVLFPITTVAATISAYKINVSVAKDLNNKGNPEEIKHFQQFKNAVAWSLICIPIVGPILHVIVSPANDNIFKSNGESGFRFFRTNIVAYVLSTPFVGSGAIAGVMLVGLLFPEKDRNERA